MWAILVAAWKDLSATGRAAVVMLSEVAPGETALCDVVARGLAERGYVGVWVAGEW